MDNRSSGSPLGDWLALLAQPASLLAAAVLFAAQLSRSFAMATVIERARSAGSYGLIGLFGMVAAIAMFAVFAIVHFMLSRRLGGPEDSEGEPGVGNWLALMLLYFLVTQLVTYVTPLFLGLSGLGFARMPLIMAGSSFVLRLVFFPVMVFLAALAHDGAGNRFSDIFSYLTTRGIGWLGGYLVLSIAVVLTPVALIAALGSPPGGAAGGGGMLVASLIVAIGQLLSIAFAIAAYRAARASKDGSAQVVF